MVKKGLSSTLVMMIMLVAPPSVPRSVFLSIYDQRIKKENYFF